MMKRAYLVPLLLMFSAGVAVAATPFVDGDADAGKDKSAVCAGCHGADGNSPSDQFPKLADQHASYILEQLGYFKDGTRPNAIMKAQTAALSKDDMKNLAAYFASQDIEPGGVKHDPDQIKLVQEGAKIYHGGSPEFKVPACSGCHGPSGLGNAGAAYPHISGQHDAYLIEQLTAFRDNTRGTSDEAEIMHGVTRGLSNHQIKALAAYVSALAPAGDEANTSGALFQNPPEDDDQDDQENS